MIKFFHKRLRLKFIVLRTIKKGLLDQTLTNQTLP